MNDPLFSTDGKKHIHLPCQLWLEIQKLRKTLKGVLQSKRLHPPVFITASNESHFNQSTQYFFFLKNVE